MVSGMSVGRVQTEGGNRQVLILKNTKRNTIGEMKSHCFRPGNPDRGELSRRLAQVSDSTSGLCSLFVDSVNSGVPDGVLLVYMLVSEPICIRHLPNSLSAASVASQ